MQASAPKHRIPVWSRPISLLPRPLLEPRRPLVAIIVGWLTALIPSVLIGAVVTLLPQTAQPDLRVSDQFTFFLVVVAAPVIETLIMAGVLAVLLKMLPPTYAVLVSSLAWGVAHSIAAPAWGLVIWWPFLVFSTLYVTWRSRSLWAALAVPATTHALQNLPPSLLMLAAS